MRVRIMAGRLTVWLLMLSLFISIAVGDSEPRGTPTRAACGCAVVVGDPSSAHIRFGGCRLRFRSIEAALGPLSLSICLTLPGRPSRAGVAGMLD